MSDSPPSLATLRRAVLAAGLKPSLPMRDDDRFEPQIERLERAELMLERRLQNADLSPVQRVQLQHKADRLNEKIEKLRHAMAQSAENAHFSERSRNSHGALAQRFRAFLRSDETETSAAGDTRGAAASHVHTWLTLMLRERRHALEEIAERLLQARRYVLRATIQLDEAVGERGSAQKAHEVRTLIGMSEEAVRDARRDLAVLAHHWQELAALAHRRDWTSLPFKQLQQALDELVEDAKQVETNESAPDPLTNDPAPRDAAAPADAGGPGPAVETSKDQTIGASDGASDRSDARPREASAGSVEDASAGSVEGADEPSLAERVHTLSEQLKATAIWLNQLKKAVLETPPPFGDVAGDSSPALR